MEFPLIDEVQVNFLLKYSTFEGSLKIVEL